MKNLLYTSNKQTIIKLNIDIIKIDTVIHSAIINNVIGAFLVTKNNINLFKLTNYINMKKYDIKINYPDYLLKIHI